MSARFILRPIATILMIVAIIGLGLLGYRILPVAALPNVDFPTIEVVTNYPGASPDVVETSITAPLEHYFGQISGLTVMNSVSAAGTSQVTLQFDLARNIDAAAQDVQSAINAASGWIPIALLPGPPTYQEVNPADVPVLILALTSETMPLHEVNEMAATTLVQKLSQVSGVGAVTAAGVIGNAAAASRSHHGWDSRVRRLLARYHRPTASRCLARHCRRKRPGDAAGTVRVPAARALSPADRIAPGGTPRRGNFCRRFAALDSPRIQPPADL